MKQDKRLQKVFAAGCWIKAVCLWYSKICDGNQLKACRNLNNPEKHVVEQETGAIDR